MNILVITPYSAGALGGGSALRMTGIVGQLAVEHQVSENTQMWAPPDRVRSTHAGMSNAARTARRLNA